MGIVSYKLICHTFFLFVVFPVLGATFTATSTTGGNWNIGTSWGGACASGCVAGTDYPGASDIANIPGGKSITIPNGFAASATTLKLNSDDGDVGASTLTFATATSSLNVSGNVSFGYSIPTCKKNISDPTIMAFTLRTHQIILTGGTFTIGGTLTMTAATNGCTGYDHAHTINLGSGTMTVTGNISMTNAISDFDGTTPIYTTIDMTTANCVLNVGNGFTVGRVLNGTGATGTINYTRAGAQTIAPSPIYYNLTLSGSGVKSLSGNGNIVNGILSMQGTATLSTALGIFVYGTNSTLEYKGSAAQSSGPELKATIETLKIDNSNGVTFNNSSSANDAVTMTSGNINLGTFTLSLGTGGASSTPGTLTYTSGRMYNGSFKRYFGTGAVAIGTAAGQFPIGSSLHYRPFWIGISSFMTTSNSVTLSHTEDYTHPAFNTASHNDATWSGGTTVKGVSKSTWNVSNAGCFTDGNDDLQVRFGGFGFGTNTLTDLDASLASSVIGTFSAATGSSTEPYVNRTGLSELIVDDVWRIGTKNIIQSPLPIELLNFEANFKENKVDVKWSTATETNNYYFTVERSADGINFEGIATITGAGNSSNLINYNKSDFEPLSGISYYRLRQTDRDGSFSYSQIVAVNVGRYFFTLGPNPASDEIFLRFSDNIINGSSIKIVDMLGRNCFEEKLLSSDFQKITLDKLTFVPGLYYVLLNVPGKPLLKQPLFVQ